MSEVFKNSKWKLKDDNISFWRDNQLKEGPLCEKFSISNFPNLRVKDCRMESGWDVSLLQRLVGERHSAVILHTLCNAKVGEDILVWTGNSDGKFSTHSAWDNLRVRSPKCWWSVDKGGHLHSLQVWLLCEWLLWRFKPCFGRRGFYSRDMEESCCACRLELCS